MPSRPGRGGYCMCGYRGAGYRLRSASATTASRQRNRTIAPATRHQAPAPWRPQRADLHSLSVASRYQTNGRTVIRSFFLLSACSVRVYGSLSRGRWV